MRKFLINVNGNSYEVEVEEVTNRATSIPISTTNKSTVNEVKKQEIKQTVPMGSLKIAAPMPGTILGVKVKSGDLVKKGEVLIILEAMKMENEIVSPSDGTISAIMVAKGSSVKTGDVMISLS